MTNLEKYLTLAFTPHLGTISFLRLIKEFKTPKQILETPFSKLAPFIEKSNLVAKHWLDENTLNQYVKPALNWLEQNKNCYILTLLDDDYPVELAEVYSPPPVLFLRGNKKLLTSHKIAIVGSRNATPQGLKTAQDMAQYISQRNFCTVSGLASGIDASAHIGALLGSGSTIAVLGTGIDLIYPKSNYELAHKIAETGLLVSEFSIGTRANAMNFPIRNRIIAGLSLATVVVEATLKSGSLITARLAMEQGKDVMAVPSSIYNPQSKGTHQLIKNGAKLIETAKEIIEDFDKSDYNDGESVGKKILATVENDELTSMVLDSMGAQLIHPDEISNILQLNTEKVHSTLLLLELEGIVQKTSGGRFQRIVF